MLFRSSGRGYVLIASIAAGVSLLAACQGNLGSGSGLSIPQAPQPYNQQGAPGQGSTSRERVLEGAVYVASPLPDIPLPTVDGFGIDIALGTPGPSPSPSAVPVASASPAAAGKRAARSRAAEAARTAAPTAAPSASPVPVAGPSASPAAGPTGTSQAVTRLSQLASPAASGEPGASAAPASSGSPANRHHPTPAPSGPKIETKTVAYPDDAPAPPTAEPTGNVQTFANRKPLLRGYLLPALDVPIYGLAAIKFTVPKDEVSAGRGFTIAVYTAAKKHRGKLLEYDTAPTAGSDGAIVSTFNDDPIVFKKGVGYELVLFADLGAATPVPLVSGYPAPGNNPFATPPPPGYPQNGSQTPVPPGYQPTPVPPGYPTPYPQQTYFH